MSKNELNERFYKYSGLLIVICLKEVYKCLLNKDLCTLCLACNLTNGNKILACEALYMNTLNKENYNLTLA